MGSEQKKITAEQRRRLIPVTHWNRYHPWPPIGGLRYLIFHAESNGFSHCIRRVGRTVLIDEPRFFEWVDRLNENTDPSKWSQLELLK